MDMGLVLKVPSAASATSYGTPKTLLEAPHLQILLSWSCWRKARRRVAAVARAMSTRCPVAW